MVTKYFGKHLFERRSWAARALCALLLCWVSVAAAEVAVPPLTGRVVDQTGTLRPSDRAALTQELKDLEARKGSQVAVLIVPTTQPETIEQYSIRVAEAWKIGRRKIDDGALLVVAKDDHKLRIEVGYGLEGSLTDVTARRIIDEVIVPRFRTGDFAGGIDAGIARIIAVVDGEPLPLPAPEARNGGGLDWLWFFPPFWIFILVGCFFCGIILNIVRALVGPLSALLGSAVTGGIAGALVWMSGGSLVAALLVAGAVLVVVIVFVTLLGSNLDSGPAPRRRYSGGRSGGSYAGGGGWSGGSSSSSSSSDSGFSGGGGDFGGGGASGSW